MRRSTAFLLALGIIVLLAWNSAGFFFRRPYYEYWDSAANSLSILRARHFAELYGPYSRYGFCHPGTGLFYIYALGEWLFYDVLRAVPSPFQGQLLINLCLMTGFYVAALSIFARWLPERRRWLFLCAALVLGILHFSLMKNLQSYEVLDSPSAFLSVWPVHGLVLPFLCLLTAGAAIGAGRGQYLPLLVLAGGILVVHVAQPLFVVPTAIIAYVGLVVSCARRQRAAALPGQPPRTRWWLAAWRDHPRAHLFAAALLCLFLLPMLIDLSRGRQSNFATILRHLHEGASDRKTLTRAFACFLQFGAYAPYQPGLIYFGHYDLPGFLAYLRAHAPLYAGWLLVLVLALQAPFAYGWSLVRRRTGEPLPPAADDTRRFLAWATLLAGLNIALTLYWGTRQDEKMYFYLSWTYYAIYYFGALIALAVLCVAGTRRLAASDPAVETKTSGGRWLAVRLVGAGAVILTGYLCADRLRIHEYDPDGFRFLHANVARALADSDADHPAGFKVLVVPDEHWPLAIAAALQLARAGDRFVVSAGRWKSTFGAQFDWRTLNAKTLQGGVFPWYVMTEGTVRRGVPADAPVFPLTNHAQLMITPPALELSAAGSTAEINFETGGNSTDYLLGGWSAQEPAGAWSDQPWAVLAFRPRAVQGVYVEISFTGVPLVSPEHGITLQRVRLLFNGACLCPEQRLSVEGRVQFIVPAATWNAAAANGTPVSSLAFEFPDAASPAALGMSGDVRTLGIFFHQIRLRVGP